MTDTEPKAALVTKAEAETAFCAWVDARRDGHRDLSAMFIALTAARNVAASPPPASYDDGVQDERARCAAIVRSADLSAEYCGEELQRLIERIEAGDAPPKPWFQKMGDLRSETPSHFDKLAKPAAGEPTEAFDEQAFNRACDVYYERSAAKDVHTVPLQAAIKAYLTAARRAAPLSALGSFACPICGHDRPHNHEAPDVHRWLNAQAGRFGYTCRIVRQDEDAFIDRVLAGLDAAQKEWRQAHGYPRTSIDEYREVIEILQSRRAAPPSGWRPIAEAPKDGTLILGYDCRVGWNYFVIRWIDGEWYTMDSDLNPFIGLPPTHFMPLPSPPAADAQETKDE